MEPYLGLSPFIAPYTTRFCRLLEQYGGCVVDTDGLLQTGVSYVRREGTSLARLIHMEDVETRASFLFVLDEVTGGYTSGRVELWPLSCMVAPSLIPRIGHHIPIPEIVDIIEDFLSDILPSRRPGYADPLDLRRQLLAQSSEPETWQHYWALAEGERQEQEVQDVQDVQDVQEVTPSGRRRLRTHPNIWPSRKRVCQEDSWS